MPQNTHTFYIQDYQAHSNIKRDIKAVVHANLNLVNMMCAPDAERSKCQLIAASVDCLVRAK